MKEKLPTSFSVGSRPMLLVCPLRTLREVTTTKIFSKNVLIWQKSFPLLQHCQDKKTGWYIMAAHVGQDWCSFPGITNGFGSWSRGAVEDTVGSNANLWKATIGRSRITKLTSASFGADRLAKNGTKRAQCRLQPQRRETNTTSKLEVGANANEKGVNSQDLTTGKDIPLQGLHCCHPQGTCKVLKKRRKERECFRSRIKV